MGYHGVPWASTGTACTHALNPVAKTDFRASTALSSIKLTEGLFGGSPPKRLKSLQAVTARYRRRYRSVHGGGNAPRRSGRPRRVRRGRRSARSCAASCGRRPWRRPPSRRRTPCLGDAGRPYSPRPDGRGANRAGSLLLVGLSRPLVDDDRPLALLRRDPGDLLHHHRRLRQLIGDRPAGDAVRLGRNEAQHLLWARRSLPGLSATIPGGFERNSAIISAP